MNAAAEGPEPRSAASGGGNLQRLSFRAGDATLSALLLTPASPRVLYVYAHGAGAGMEHRFMEASAQALAARGIATFRYNFPYREIGRGPPDPAAVLVQVVRTAVEVAVAELPGVPVFAGGKSMGGRMSSEAQARAPLPGVLGLVFVGFPLHRPKKPAMERADHLARVEVPMLFLQGTRDEMARLDLVREVADGLGDLATLHVVEGADHGFAVLKRSGRTGDEVLEELAHRIDCWMSQVIGAAGMVDELT